MIVKTYKARRGGYISQKDAEVIGPYLEQKFGDKAVTPHAFLVAAQTKRSPLHRYFQWDDHKAATEYRVWQAREILGSLMVIVETPSGGEIETRAYHNIVVENGERHRVYAPQHIVWQSETLREQVIMRALRDLERWEAQYGQYEELARVAELVAAAKGEIAA